MGQGAAALRSLRGACDVLRQRTARIYGIAKDHERGLERLAARDEVLVLYSHDIMAKSDGGASICNNTSLDVLARILSKARALGIDVIGFDEIGTFADAGGKPVP